MITNKVRSGEVKIQHIYIEEIKCKNCGCENLLEIPKGTLIRDFAQTKICKKCGCHIR